MQKKVVLVGAVLSGLILTACSSAQPMWRKAGITPFDMNSTLAKCRYEVRAAKVAQNERNAMVSDCMESQGFRYTDY
jgi:hypothetical protein